MGKPVSQTTGLYYDYQRWYDPSIGRFISQDPLAGDPSNPQSFNPYVYAGDSPSSATDPTGLAVAGISSSVSIGSCPSFWSNPWGSFSCQLSRTPTPVGDIVAGYDLAVWGLAECEEECGQLLHFGSGDTVASTGSDTGLLTRGGITSPASDALTTTVTKVATETDIATVDLSNAVGNSNDIVSTSRFWSTTERGGFNFEATQLHHLLPRQFRAFFAGAGINIDDYTVQLDQGVHMVLHGRGGLYAESWNPAWRLFLLQNPNADSAQILGYLRTLLEGSGF